VVVLVLDMKPQMVVQEAQAAVVAEHLAPFLAAVAHLHRVKVMRVAEEVLAVAHLPQVVAVAHLLLVALEHKAAQAEQAAQVQQQQFLVEPLQAQDNFQAEIIIFLVVVVALKRTFLQQQLAVMVAAVMVEQHYWLESVDYQTQVAVVVVLQMVLLQVLVAQELL
jgi:hypothetical protein